MKTIRGANILFPVTVLSYLAVSFFTGFLARYIPVPVPVLLVAGEVGIMLPTVIYCLVTRNNPFRWIQRKRLDLMTILLVVLFTYCMYPLIMVINMFSMFFADNAAAGVLDILSGLPMPAALLVIAVVPAVFEEFFCRGMLYHTYRRRGIWAGAFISALMFGLLHMNLNQFCYAFFMGIMFVLLIEATGSIYASMLAHFLYNGTSVVLTYLTASSDSGAAASGDLSAALEESGFHALFPDMPIGFLQDVFLAAGILIMGFIAIATTALAVLLLIAIAKRNGRFGHLRVLFSPKKRKAAESARSIQDKDLKPRYVVDIWAVLGIVLCIAMFFIL